MPRYDDYQDLANATLGMAASVRSMRPAEFLASVTAEAAADPERMGQIVMTLAALVDPDEDEDTMLDRIDQVVAAATGTDTPSERQRFAEEYLQLRERAWTHQRIADHYRISIKSLYKRCERSGVWAPEEPERIAERHLTNLIARGHRFSPADIPGSDQPARTRALHRAVQQGRIARVGTRKSRWGNPDPEPVYAPIAVTAAG